MPRTTKPGGRRYGSKYMSKSKLRKAKTVLGNQKARMAKKNMDTHFLRCTTNTLMYPAQGVTVSNYTYGFFPLFTTGTPPDYDIRKNPEFILGTKQYDRVRINRVTIKVTPKANVLDQTAGQDDANYTLTGTGTIHTAIDRDGSVPVALDAFRKMSSYKQYSVMKKFQRSYSVKWPQSVWLDCDAFLSADNQITRTIGCSGGITIYGENLVEDSGELFNEPWAQVEVVYDCVFQGKTNQSISVAQDGSVVIRPHVNKENPTNADLIKVIEESV